MSRFITNSSNNSSIGGSSSIIVHRGHSSHLDHSGNILVISGGGLDVADQPPISVFQPTSSPVIEATDEEEHDLGVYGLGHHKSLPLSDSSPVNDDSGTGGNSNHSGSRIEGGLNEAANPNHSLMLEPNMLTTPTRTNGVFPPSGGGPIEGPYYVVGQSSDSNLYSLDDDAALLDEDEDDDEEIFAPNPPDADTLRQGSRCSPSSSQKTVIQNLANQLDEEMLLKKQASQTSGGSGGNNRQQRLSSTSSRRCQCVECQLLEHQLNNDESSGLITTTKKHHNQSISSRNGSGRTTKRHQPPTTLSIDSSGGRGSVNHYHHSYALSHPKHNQVSPTSSTLQPPPQPRNADQQEGAAVLLARAPSSLSTATESHMSAIMNHGSPPLFYAIRDGVIFQPGLPPSLSVESLRNAPNYNTSTAVVSSHRRLDQLFGTATVPSGSGNNSKTGRHHHRHHRSKIRSKGQQVAATAPLKTKHQHHRHHRHHSHFRHSKVPPVPASSPTVASRHFGMDTGGYPSTSSRRELAPLTGDGAVLNFSSFRVIIERIKRWFLVKSRKILAPRNLFGRGGASGGLRRSASSLSSLAASSSSLSGASSSSTTSLCDSNPSLSDLGIVVPPLVKGSLLAPPSALSGTANAPVTITVGGRLQRDAGSSSSLSSSESTNSLLELKKRVVRQRREMAEKEQLLQQQQQQQLQQQQPQQESHRQNRQKQYLQVHGKNAFTVTSTISCPTGRYPVSRRAGTLKVGRRNNPETSTLSTNDFDHGSLQLSASWPLVDRLATKLVQQQADAMFAPGAVAGNQIGGDPDASAFYNENGGETGGPHTHAHTSIMASMAERRAGWRHHLTQQTQDSARDSVCSDCAIPFQDLEFGECVRDSEGHKIFSGRWYGTVMIHLFSGFSDRDVGAFWSEVHKMVTLRHDNVALFMGAAVERSALAIVISVQTHISLFDQIHINATSMAPNVLTIGRQLAQGMGYLHSRNIVLGHLNSRNVFIDGKLKISMADCSKPRRDFVKHGCACLSRGVVTYLAPELIKSLSLVQQQQHINLPPKICFQQAPTTDTDVYAFGTLLYEVAYSDFPFAGTPLEVVIYQIATGCRPSFEMTSSPTSNAPADSSLLGSIKQLIEDCWCHDPLSRPLFKDIYRHIQEISPSNQALAEQQRRRCSSVPERLNHLSSSQRTGGIAYY